MQPQYGKHGIKHNKIKTGRNRAEKGLEKGLRKGRVLISLMKTMESEGMYLKKSDILANAAEAEAVGSKLHINKSDV